MNLPDLHINEALRQREFPVCADKVYLAHAGVSPVPASVTRALQETAAAAALDDQEEGLGDLLRTTRARAQPARAEESGCRNVYSLDASHSPFFSAPADLARILGQIAES